MKICAISDTHNAHNKLVIPPCDILIHAGDESMMGRKSEIENFFKWFDKQPAKHLVWIPGNHSCDFAGRYPSSLSWVKDISPQTNVLLNSSVELEGLKIWGSPYTPWFHDWSYNVNRGPDIQKHWDLIPSGTDIVVTHGPPYGILDLVDGEKVWQQHVGCQNLMDTILKIKPKLHVFGHIHEGYGTQHFMDTTYVNASIMDKDYDPANLPIILDL